VDTLRATARALCLKREWEEAKVVVRRLYQDEVQEGKEGRRRTWRRSAEGQRQEYREGQRLAKRRGMRRVERVGGALSLAFLEVCHQGEAWSSALSFVDEVLLEKEREKGEGEEGREEGQAVPVIPPLENVLAQAALQICVGAGDAGRVLAIVKRTAAVEPALLDLALQACAAHKQRLSTSSSSSSSSSSSASSVLPPPPPVAAAAPPAPPAVAPVAAVGLTQLGVTVLSLLREARSRTPGDTAPAPAPAPAPAGAVPVAVTPSPAGWEAAASALTAAGPLRLLLSEAKRAATAAAAAAAAAAVDNSPSSLPSSSSSSASLPPMWLLMLYGKAIKASVDERQNAEALLLYREVVDWAAAEGEGGREGGKEGKVTTIVSSVVTTTTPISTSSKSSSSSKSTSGKSSSSSSSKSGSSSSSSSSGSSSSCVIPLAIHEAAIGAYAAQGQWRPALEVLDRLRKGGREGGGGGGPSLVCFNAAIRACCLGNEWERGVGLLRRMEAAGQRADEKTYQVILQAFARTGEWKGSLKLLEYIDKKREGGREGGVTPALARAAAEICVRAHRYEEARALVASVMHRGGQETSSSSPSSSSSSSSSSPSSSFSAVPAAEPAFLALGLWSLASATPSSWAGPFRQEEALQLITSLMESNAPIALETYEHACQALLSLGGSSTTTTTTTSSNSQKYEAALRDVYRHGVAAGVLPSSPPSLPSSPSTPSSSSSSSPSVELRGLRPTLAKVAMVTALESLLHLHHLESEEEGGRERRSASQAPLIIITGTGRVKGAVQHFLRTACFPPLLPQPMPYNAGRLLLPWSQIQRWQEEGGVVTLTMPVGVASRRVGGGGKGGGGRKPERTRPMLWAAGEPETEE